MSLALAFRHRCLHPHRQRRSALNAVASAVAWGFLSLFYLTFSRSSCFHGNPLTPQTHETIQCKLKIRATHPDGWDKETPTSLALTGPGLVQYIFSAPPRPGFPGGVGSVRAARRHAKKCSPLWCRLDCLYCFYGTVGHKFRCLACKLHRHYRRTDI